MRGSLALTILAIEGISGRSFSPSTIAPLEDDEANDFVSSKLTFSLMLLKVFNQLIRTKTVMHLVVHPNLICMNGSASAVTESIRFRIEN